MRRLFSTFAHGAPGAGLLLLRLAIASTLIYGAVLHLVGHTSFALVAFYALSILLGLLLLAGLWTPIAGALVAVIATCELVSHPASWPQFALITDIAAALVLLGPGAWSIDARLYGWKEIMISDRRRSGPDSPD